MDEERTRDHVAVTGAWGEEQRAKQEAYEAKRRAWVRMFERGFDAEQDEPPGAADPAAAGVTGTGGASIRERRASRGGTIQDRRQTRFIF